VFIILPKPVYVNKSLIFSTFKNDIIKSNGELELFGKSVNKIFTDLGNKKGILNSLFDNAITDDDIKAINNYADALSRGISPATAWNDTMTNCSSAAQKAAASYGDNVKGLKALTTATTTSTAAMKVGAVATKLLSTALNMISFMLVAQGISLAVKGLDNLAHASERCKERVDELMSSYKSALDTANNNAKTIESLVGKYENLSKGVNNLGRNISLTTGEYSEYNDIVNRIADMFPTLITGYTDEGNAILSLKGNVEQLRDAYKEAQQEAYRLLIVSGKNSDGDDIIDNFNNEVFGKESWLSKSSSFIDGEGGAKDAIDIITKLTGSLTPDEFRDTYDKLYEEYKNIWESNKVHDALKSSGIEDLTHKWSDITSEDLDNVKQSANATVQTYQAEINSALKNVQTLGNAYLLTNEDYSKLDKEAQTAASIIVNSIDENIASGFNNKVDVGTYVSSIVDMLQGSSEIKDSLISLLTLDTSNLSAGNMQDSVNRYINTIASALNEDPVDLKIRLGFEDYVENGKIDSQIANVKSKLQKKFDNNVGELSLEDLGFAARLDVPRSSLLSWDELIEKIEEAKAKASESTPISFDITNEDTAKSIDDFQSKLNSLSSALTKVKDNKLTGSELLDLQQQFPELIGQTDNLSEALTNLIDNTLTDVIDFLDHAGAPDDLIDSFRQIAEEAKGISFDGWKETLDVFDKVNSSMSSLSDFTKALGKDYAITATEARKFAEVFPELLALGETTSSGLIQFNKGVVDAFIDGKQTEIKVDAEARIQELNNQKAVIEGKMALAQAELLLLEGQGNAKIEAENQTNEGIAEAQKNLVQYLVNLGTEEANADATVKEIMAGNTEEYDRVVAEVSGNVHDNLSNSISGAADNVDTSSHSMIDSLYSVAQQAVNTAKSIASIGSENPFEAVKTTLNGAKNAIKGFNPVESISDFKRMVGENIDIDQYTRSERMVKLELDITGYQETLSGIESQIALLEASGNKSLKDYDTGSGGSKKSKEEAEKEIDWAERTLKQLKEQRDELEKKSSSSFLAYLGLTPEEFEKARLIVESTDTLMTKDLRELRDIAQNAGMSMSDLIDLVENGGDTESKRSYLSQLIEHDKLALRTYDFAIDAYRKKYDELAKDISPEDLNKIENNSMDISLYSGDDAKKIEDVIDAYEKWKNTVKGKAELEAEANDNIKNYYDNNIEYLDHQAKRIESTNFLINSQINYLKESGQIVSATSYEQLISNNKQIISYYEQKIKEAEKKLAELMSKEDFDITSKEYYDIQEELSGYRQVIIDTDVEVQQLANDLLNLPIDNMDIVISMYESITDTIQRWGSEMEASGKKLDKEYYQSLINNGMTVIDQYKEQYDLVRDVMDEYDTGSEKWNTLYNKLQSINSAMSSMVENLYKWNEALLQLPFDSVSTLSDNLTKALSAMTNVQSEYDTVISAVVGALQEEIDLLNEARDAANEETEAQIDELKSRLDLLNQQNEALKLQAAYEQALYDLQNANTQKTERVIRDGQLVYETNADNLRQAQSDVQDALLDLEKYNLEQEIEALEEQLDAVNDQYEEQIKNLEKISEKWSEITSKIEQAKNEVTATDILGDGWKDKVLSGNDDDIFNMFSGMYQSISDQITLYEDQIASTENIEVLLQDYITAYKEGTITYEQAMTGINDLLSQLNEKMSATDNLNNVLDYVGAVTGTDDTSISGILSALQKSLQETGDELIKSFELYNENAGNISEYTTSWQQLTIDVSDIKDILEEVRDNLEDTLDNISRSRDRDEDLEDDLGDTSSNGGRAIGVGDASGSSYHGSSVDSSNDDQDPNNGPGVYAKGMENGLVGANTDSNREGILKKMVLNRIEDPANAIPIIAHEGEAILNRSQQDTLIENYYNAYESYPSIPDWFANYKMPTYDFSGIGKSSEGDILCHNEKIIIEKCDNPDQLAEGILKGGLASAMRMRAGRR